jgi:N-ethylmaleimide reductase
MSRPPLRHLLSPVHLGPYELRNRIVMAPMTRRRAGSGDVPTQAMATYYAQRASAGLIVSEATLVSPTGASYPGSPGIYADVHAAAWRPIAAAVHHRGGRIFLQLWHAGRVSHPSMLPGGGRPVAPSAIAIRGEIATPADEEPFPTPRALDPSEIREIVVQFAEAARRARDAGLDGVEVHAAQGYLIDQFLRDGSNRRNDDYGGPVEHRARLLLEVLGAVCRVWDGARVGVQLSPRSALNDMRDSDPVGTFGYVAGRLNEFGLAYLHVFEPVGPDAAGDRVTPRLRAVFRGTLIANGGYDRGTAEFAIDSGAADLVSFGRPFIANPDLPERFAAGAPLNQPDPATFYDGGERGYTDYAPYRIPAQ